MPIIVTPPHLRSVVGCFEYFPIEICFGTRVFKNSTYLAGLVRTECCQCVLKASVVCNSEVVDTRCLQVLRWSVELGYEIETRCRGWILVISSALFLLKYCTKKELDK